MQARIIVVSLHPLRYGWILCAASIASSTRIRVSGLGQRIGDLVREVALKRIVATEFLEQRDDLCGLSLSEDGELEGQLFPPCGQLVIKCRCAINTFIALIKSATVDTITESKENGKRVGRPTARSFERNV